MLRILWLLCSIGRRKVELRWRLGVVVEGRLVQVVRRAGRSCVRRLLIHRLWRREGLELVHVRCRLPHRHGSHIGWWELIRLTLRWTLSKGSTTEFVVPRPNFPGVVGVSASFVDFPNVIVELVRDFSNNLEVTGLDHGTGIGLGILVASQCNRALEGVANLAPVPGRPYFAGAVVLIFEKTPSKLDQSVRVTLHFHWRLAGTTNQVSPDLLGSEPVQWWIVQGHMYPGLEGLIENTNSVCCQESKALIRVGMHCCCVGATYRTPS